MKKYIPYKFILFIVLIILGVYLRLWMASRFPHQPLFDETDYLSFAKSLISNFWYADCCAKTYGYPLFLSLLFSLFGLSNLKSIIIAQALLDTATALILYIASTKIFSNKNLAFATFIIYLFNPLTASFTGLILSEIWALFLMGLVLLLLINNKKSLLRQFILGILIGLLTFTRIMLWWWTIAFLLILCLGYILFEKKRMLTNLFLIIGFMITVIYPTVANWKFYKTLSPLPPVPFAYLDFLHSLQIARWPGLFNEEYFKEVPIEVSSEHPKVFGPDRKIFMEKIKPRMETAKQEIKEKPLPFIASRIRNVFLFWDKSHLYFYSDPFYPKDKLLVRIANILFISFSILGIASVGSKRQKTIVEKKFLLFTIILCLYFTFPLSLLTPEERITLPVYPVLAIFTPLGISVSLNRLRSL